MKKLKKAGVILLTIPVLLIIINQFIMRTIKTEITINASKEKVWNILMNHKAYPNWNPFIKRVEGDVREGGTLKVTVQSEGNSPMDFTPVVLRNEDYKEFRWRGKLFVDGLFDGEHSFEIIEDTPNRVQFMHEENFTGLLSGVLTKMIFKDTQKGFVQMNEALKAMAERR